MSLQRRCDVCDRKIEGKFWRFQEIDKETKKDYDVCNCCFLKLTKRANDERNRQEESNKMLK